MSQERLSKGQSIVELVFAMAILGLVMFGSISLLLLVVNNRNRSMERKKGTIVAQAVMENLVDESLNIGATFWELKNRANETLIDYPGYVVNIGFTNIHDNVNYNNCGVGETNCANAVVEVGWDVSDSKIIVSRFFWKR